MSYTLDLSGRVALITGASSGLGKQFALTLSKAGAAVVLGGRRIERLKDLRSEIEAGGGDAHVVGLDVTDLASIRSAVAHAETEVGPIDILINNSGVSTTERLVDVSEESYDYVFDTNTRGAFFVAQSVARRMIARSRDEPGRAARIVNIASMAALKPLDGGADTVWSRVEASIEATMGAGEPTAAPDWRDVRGQSAAKRALEVATKELTKSQRTVKALLG